MNHAAPNKIRTRIAPSPTGLLHIGTARTALFNYLFAKQNQGAFILRIEDTDKERSKPEYEKDVIDSLKWLGLEWDEGPDIGGAHGPYRQSEKLNVYSGYLKKLLEENKAYYCFCSEEELEAQRQYQLSIGETPCYNGKCAQISPEEAQKRMEKGETLVIRFRIPSKKVEFDDLIRGKVEFDSGLLGDTVIAKDPNTPLYNFSVVVDDFEMKISHVIRGEEHISNTPRQILIQEALGFDRPQYGHLPLILAPDRSKLSKRHGATAVIDYKKEGYLPEAMINFIAFFGWNPGGEREIFALPSLVKEFNLEKVQKGGAIFNQKRLEFLNGFYIRQRSPERLAELCVPYLIEAGLISQEGIAFKIKETGQIISLEALKNIVVLYQERLKKLSEIVELTDFFFTSKLKYDRGLLKWKEASDQETKISLDKLEKLLSKIKEGDWTKENLELKIMPEAEAMGPAPEPSARYGAGDRGYLLWPFRVALTGKQASAGPFEIAAVLGKEKTLKRIDDAKFLISKS